MHTYIIAKYYFFTSNRLEVSSSDIMQRKQVVKVVLLVRHVPPLYREPRTLVSILKCRLTVGWQCAPPIWTRSSLPSNFENEHMFSS